LRILAAALKARHIDDLRISGRRDLEGVDRDGQSAKDAVVLLGSLGDDENGSSGGCECERLEKHRERVF
jgi:hypothetical protein